MPNHAMARKLLKREAIDVADCPRTAGGDYLLQNFGDGFDYCDSRDEAWIWSIARITRPLPSIMLDGSARTLQPGEYLASRSTKFYNGAQDLPGLQCVWLR